MTSTTCRAKDGYISAALPVPCGADYSFTCEFYDDEDFILFARLLSDVDALFWHVTFEACSGIPREDLMRSFLDALEIVTHYRTRIFRERRLLSWGFDCQYFEAEEWRDLCGCSYFRWGGVIDPATPASETVFSSPPLCPIDATVRPRAQRHASFPEDFRIM